MARKWVVPFPVGDTETSRDKAGYQTGFFYIDDVFLFVHFVTLF